MKVLCFVFGHAVTFPFPSLYNGGDDSMCIPVRVGDEYSVNFFLFYYYFYQRVDVRDVNDGKVKENLIGMSSTDHLNGESVFFCNAGNSE